MWTNIYRKLTSVGSSAIPSGIRRAWRRETIRRRHGLVSLGADFTISIAKDVCFGRNCRIGGPVFIAGSSIGDHTYIEVGSRISEATIGKFCSIASYALIGPPEHPTQSFVSTHPMFYRSIPSFGYTLLNQDTHQELNHTTIGNDVWIGAGAVIRSGLSVGDGAIVGAGSVVTKSLDPYTIYGGVPARPIRQRFDEETIDLLKRIRWWDQDQKWLQEHIADMQDINRFAKTFGDT